MSEFRNLFEEYGANYEVTMNRFLQNEAMYLRLLNKLPADPNIQRLEKALGRGDLPDAFEAAHTLKGVAGNLGLTPLLDAVSAIVEPLRAGKVLDYTKLFLAVRQEFGRVEALLEAVKRGGQA